MTRRYKLLQLQAKYSIGETDSDLGEQIIQGFPLNQFEVVNAFLQGQPEAGEQKSKAERMVFFNFTDRELKGLRRKVKQVLREFCEKEKFDAVILHRFKAVNLFMHINRSLHIPVCIGISHGFGEYERFYRRWQARRLIDKYWHFVGVSQSVCDYLIGCHCGFTPENTTPIPNAIDIELAVSGQLPREQARADLGLEAEPFIFGAIGRLVPVKGHIHLINAFARIAEVHPEARVVIIGDGREREKLEAAIAGHGLQTQVILCGARPNAMQYIRAFDAFVMPSWSEGLPLALLEGMSGRLPVMGSDIPAMHSLLESAGGTLFPPGNEAAIVDALESCLALTPEQIRSEGEGAFDYLCREHDIHKFREKYYNLALKLLDDSRSDNS